METRPALMRLVEDDRIYQTVTELLGDDLIWIGSEGMWGIDPGLADHTWHFDGSPSIFTPHASFLKSERPRIRQLVERMRVLEGKV